LSLFRSVNRSHEIKGSRQVDAAILSLLRRGFWLRGRQTLPRCARATKAVVVDLFAC
jgi:hypothetical protein